MATTKVTLTGPLFNGEAETAAADFTRDLSRELALIGQSWIQIEAHGYDKSGRGGTGAAADGVEVIGEGPGWVIRGGIRAGVYSWPWLEGTSPRNKTTGFKGYHPFRRTRLRLRRQASEYAQELLREFITRMGGSAF